MLFSFVPRVAFVAAVADLLLPDEQRDSVAGGLPPWCRVTPWIRALTRHYGLWHDRDDRRARALLLLLWAASGMMAAIRVAFRVIWALLERAGNATGAFRDADGRWQTRPWSAGHTAPSNDRSSNRLRMLLAVGLLRRRRAPSAHKSRSTFFRRRRSVISDPSVQAKKTPKLEPWGQVSGTG
jgi:hypothetical protein